MKTYFRDFSIDNNVLVDSRDELEELINNRQNKFCKTVEYNEINSKIESLMGELAKLSPEAQKIVMSLGEEFLRLECSCFSAAYRDGMEDLMAAVTLNKIGVTKVECYAVKGGEQAEEAGQGEGCPPGQCHPF